MGTLANVRGMELLLRRVWGSLTVNGDPDGPYDFRPLARRSLAIWEIRAETLQAAWTLFAVERARPTSFATQKGSGLLLAKYVRER